MSLNRVIRLNGRRLASSGTTMIRKTATNGTSKVSSVVSQNGFSNSVPKSVNSLSSKDEKPVKRLQGYTTTLQETLDGGLLENPIEVANDTSAGSEIYWYTSFHGIGSKPFDQRVQQELAQALKSEDIEIKPDGLIYLPEIKYRRILNKSFGPGGWGLVPRSETIVTSKLVTREYGLICHGQLVSIARGEQDYFSETGIPTATEGCKSNALMRCCKDLGIGSELWDPVFIKSFKKEFCTEKFVEHVTTKKKKKIWLRKDRSVEYPYK